MEVKHPHHVTHKKKWGEYLLEFLMLFLAVFLGFIAENIRENRINREKEKQYMESMLEDLKNDTSTINKEIGYTDSLKNGLSITFNAIHNMAEKKGSVQQLYKYYFTYERIIGFNFHDATEIEMKNADGLRLIKKKNVTEKIIEYWKRIELLQSFQTYYNEREAKSEEVGYKVFDRVYIGDYVRHVNTFMVQINIDSSAKLITNDPSTLLEQADRLWLLRNSLNNWYIPGLEKTKTTATELIDLIKKEYDLEDK